MGLYGSEYWTYLLPRRIGHQQARELTENCLPVSTRTAKKMGLIDDVFGTTVTEFHEQVYHRAGSLARSPSLRLRLHLKHQTRQIDERIKPLRSYRGEELAKMAVNFGDARYHLARQAFVYKRQLAGSSSNSPFTRVAGGRETGQAATVYGNPAAVVAQ